MELSCTVEHVINTTQAPQIEVEGRNSKLLNFCSSDYLGIASHPEVIEAGKKALDNYGAGPSSGRILCGTTDMHIKLEKQIADFHCKDDAILYQNCYAANTGLFKALLEREDAVFSDELNHASIIDGIRLCKAQRHLYKHLDMRDLEAKLSNSKGSRMKLIVTDGVFSMDADVAPMKKIVELAHKYNAVVFSDESHTTGILGKTGRGIEEYCDLNEKIDIINSTLGKGLGGAIGGYTAGSKNLISLLRQKSRPYVFSNLLPPVVVCQASKVMELLLSATSGLRNKLQQNTQQFRNKMKAAGVTLFGSDDHPVSPVIFGDTKIADEVVDEMLQQGIFVLRLTYPVVPKGTTRIRVQISAVHSTEDIDRCVNAFINIAQSKGII